MAIENAETGNPWSRMEVEAVVSDYFDMLAQELAGQSYSKAAHRRRLIPKLRGRSEPSVELKHQNISAILLKLGAPWIAGYKPRRNYQQLLFEVVADRVTNDRRLDEVAGAAVEQPAVAPAVPDFAHVWVQAPTVQTAARPEAPYVRKTIGARRDYLGLEARNRSLGTAGEEFVVSFERYRLLSLGEKRLANKVEHVASTKGDGLGYDVLSFDSSGKERLIEVKTTAFGREAPFYLTKAELALSRAEADHFHLYRLFEFRRKPRMFDLPGAVDKNCALDPVNFLASFR